MKVLITGAAGFIGAHVTRALEAAGNDVTGLVLPGESTWRLDALGSAARVVRGDLVDRDRVRAVVAEARPDACVHLAWYAAPGKYLAARENLDCLAASLYLAERLAESGCTRFVGAGTCFEYDLRGDAPLTESSPTAPTNLYAGCKLATYDALSQFAPTVGMRFAWLRFFYLYGPYEAEARLVPAVMRALLRGEETRTSPGAQVRDFLHVEDVASACVRALDPDAGLDGIVNVGSGRPLTVRALVDAIGKACGRPELVTHGALPYRPGDPMYVCADASRLRNAGWSERFDLASGLAQTAAFWTSKVEASNVATHA